MAVGLINVSSNDMTGNSTGNPRLRNNAALDYVGQLAEVRITRRQFRPRVANADDGFTAELLIGMPWFFIQAR